MTAMTIRIVSHEPDCRCPIEEFAGRAVDCFDHAACRCLTDCKRITAPTHPPQDHLGGRPDWP